MSAEIAKLRSLPTPRWTAIVVFGLVGIGFLALAIWGGENTVDYEDSVAALVGVTNIASIVIGVWVMGLEYGQNTLRRTLTADPRRNQLVLAKLGAALGWLALLTIAAMLAAIALFSLAASMHGAGSPAGESFDHFPAALFSNLAYASLGLGVALVTRSMAGGMTAMLALVFVFDIVLGVIPGADQWSFGIAVSDITDAISGEEDNGSIGHALLVVGLWFVVVIGGGWARFTRSDVA